MRNQDSFRTSIGGAVTAIHPDKPSRVERRRARARADLLAAAERIFARSGYHEATVTEIAEAADVAVGTFYLHFDDKDDIFTTLLREGFACIGARLDQLTAGIPRERSLPTLIRGLFQAAYEERDLFRITLTGGGRLSIGFRAQAHLADRIAGALEAAGARGMLAADEDVPLLARLITGMLAQGITWWFEHDEPGPDAMADRVLRLLACGLPSGLLDDAPHP